MKQAFYYSMYTLNYEVQNKYVDSTDYFAGDEYFGRKKQGGFSNIQY
jgi:hypothetical protein